MDSATCVDKDDVQYYVPEVTTLLQLIIENSYIFGPFQIYVIPQALRHLDKAEAVQTLLELFDCIGIPLHKIQ